MTKVYKKSCKFCGQVFESLYEKQLENTLRIHELYCKKKQTKLEDEENGNR